MSNKTTRTFAGTWLVVYIVLMAVTLVIGGIATVAYFLATGRFPEKSESRERKGGVKPA